MIPARSILNELVVRVAILLASREAADRETAERMACAELAKKYNDHFVQLRQQPPTVQTQTPEEMFRRKIEEMAVRLRKPVQPTTRASEINTATEPLKDATSTRRHPKSKTVSVREPRAVGSGPLLHVFGAAGAQKQINDEFRDDPTTATWRAQNR